MMCRSVETQLLKIVPPGHPSRFFSSFSFSFFFSFFVFPLLFVVLRVPVPCSFFVRFVLSSCRFPFVSCVAFFAFLLVSLLSLMADYIILLFRLGATPLCALCEPQACVLPLRSVFFLAF